MTLRVHPYDSSYAVGVSIHLSVCGAADASVFVAGTSVFVAGASVFVAGASVFVAGASLFVSGASVFVTGASVFVADVSVLDVAVVLFVVFLAALATRITSAALRVCASTCNNAWWSVSNLSCTNVISPRYASLSLMCGFCRISMSHGIVTTCASKPTIETSLISHNFIAVCLLPSGVFHSTFGISISVIAISRRLSSRMNAEES